MDQTLEVSDYSNNARGDVGYWGLTHAQAARYHARLSRMHADASQRFADLANMYARKAKVTGYVGMGIALLTLVLLAVDWVVVE